MNYFRDIAKMLGVEWDAGEDESEKFALEGFRSIYYFTENGGLRHGNDYSSSSLDIILGGKRKITKTPWKPKRGENYYCPNLLVSNLVSCSFWTNHSVDEMLFSRGLIFKTKNEAIVMAESLLKLVKETRGNV